MSWVSAASPSYSSVVIEPWKAPQVSISVPSTATERLFRHLFGTEARARQLANHPVLSPSTPESSTRQSLENSHVTRA
jgi:hypothetical protein